MCVGFQGSAFRLYREKVGHDFHFGSERDFGSFWFVSVRSEKHKRIKNKLLAHKQITTFSGGVSAVKQPPRKVSECIVL